MKKINTLKWIQYYIFSLIILHVLFIIAPVNSLFIETPLYNFQRYYALVGCLLLLIDLVRERYLFKEKYAYFLYGIVVAAAVSSLLTISYEIKHNLFAIIWMVLTIALIYTYSLRVENEVFSKQMYLVYKVVATIWLLACLASIASFLFNTGYSVRLDTTNKEAYIRQGFVENRLFGVFMSMYTAAMFSSVLLMASIFYYMLNKRKYLLFNSIIFLIYIILSGTRSAMISLTVIAILFMTFYTYKKLNTKQIIKKITLSLAAALITGVGVYTIFNYSKVALAPLSEISVFQKNKNKYSELIQKMPRVKQNNKKPKEVAPNKSLKQNQGKLVRRDVTAENPSNNRLQIWKDYLKIGKEIGIFGLSPYNFSKYIQENHKELFIVSYVKNTYPDKFKMGIIYQPHNSYIYLFVATGFVGVAFFAVYSILLLKNILRYLIVDGRDVYINFSIVVVIFTAVIMMFDTTVFFTNEATVVIFWLLLGYLVKNTKQRNN